MTHYQLRAAQFDSKRICEAARMCKERKARAKDHHHTRHSPNSLFATDRLCYTVINERTILRENLLLAHLSQKIIGELIGYSWSGVRPSVGVVRPSESSVRRSRPQCSKIFFFETALPIIAKFYVQPPWVGGTISCSRHLGHMTKMAATPIYGKKPFKNLLQNRQADFHETWYVASETPAYHSLFK